MPAPATAAMVATMQSRRNFLIRSCFTGLACAAASRAGAEISADGFTVLHAKPGEARLPGESAAPIVGFDGIAPGPVLRARRGEEVKVRLVNGLSEPTAIHWHGVRLRNGMDGAPPLTQSAVAPGASFDYRFVPPDAGTFWYRASVAHQQELGLYGALIVSEPEPPAVDRDEVLVFADWPLGAAGPSRHFAINGSPALEIAVRRNERLRLRFINASLTQVMNARIGGHRVLVMALDGEPAEPFAARDSRIVLGPGNRADVFVDALAEPGTIAPIVFALDGGEAQLVRLVYGGDAARPVPPGEPMPLASNPLPARMNFAGALRVTLPIGAAPITDAARAPPRLFAAEHGRTVMMALENRSTAHAVHLHGHHFRLLDRLDDGWKPYWLDTIVVGAGETARIAFVADNPGRWLIEQQALDGLAAATHWFQVN